jgi:hypothetical protein
MEAIQQHITTPASDAAMFRRTVEAIRLMVSRLASTCVLVNSARRERASHAGRWDRPEVG